MNKVSDIDVSLSQGQLYGTKHFIVLWLSIIISSLLVAIGIILLTLFCIELEWNGEIFFSCVFCIIIGSGFLISMIYCFVKDKKIKKCVSLWLEDAVKITALTNKVDEFRAGFQPLSVKICVKFNLNGLTYFRESSAKCFGGKPGYLGVFKHYMDKEISILYSPKYDEILLLKEQNPQ